MLSELHNKQRLKDLVLSLTTLDKKEKREISEFLQEFLNILINHLELKTASCYLFLDNQENREKNTKLTLFSSFGEEKEYKSQIFLKPEEEEKLIITDSILTDSNLDTFPNLQYFNSDNKKLKPIITLKYNKLFFGFLALNKVKSNVNKFDNFDDFDFMIFTLLSDYLSRVIFNFNNLKQIIWKEADISYTDAITDPVSGVYIKAFTEQRLIEEVKEAVRYKREYSFLLISLDNLNQLRSTHSEQTIHDIFTSMGKTIKTVLRKDVDIAGKFDDETFILILPSTPLNGTSILSNRLKEKIEQIPDVVISIGFTSLEETDKNKDNIIEKLTEALKYSKRFGGDRITFHNKGQLSVEKLSGTHMLTDKDGNSVDFTAPMIKKQWFNIPKY